MDYEEIIAKMQDKIEELEEGQKTLAKKVFDLEMELSSIESDIYENDEMGFKIVCPYCNAEFETEIEEEEEIECPECHNKIELDWDYEDVCGCGCDDEGCHCGDGECDCDDDCDCGCEH